MGVRIWSRVGKTVISDLYHGVLGGKYFKSTRIGMGVGSGIGEVKHFCRHGPWCELEVAKSLKTLSHGVGIWEQKGLQVLQLLWDRRKQSLLLTSCELGQKISSSDPPMGVGSGTWRSKTLLQSWTMVCGWKLEKTCLVDFHGVGIEKKNPFTLYLWQRDSGIGN